MHSSVPATVHLRGDLPATPPSAAVVEPSGNAALPFFASSWDRVTSVLPDPLPWAAAPSAPDDALHPLRIELSTPAKVRSLRVRVFKAVDAHGKPTAAPLLELSCGDNEPSGKCRSTTGTGTQIITLPKKGAIAPSAYLTVSAVWNVYGDATGKPITTFGKIKAADLQLVQFEAAWLLRSAA